MDEGNQFARGHPAIHVLPAILSISSKKNNNYNLLCKIKFDKIKIDSPALLEVRWANENEKLKLLNGDEIKCTSDLAVIADEAGPLTLAGIMGGERSMVTEKTKNILVEAAFGGQVLSGEEFKNLG